MTDQTPKLDAKPVDRRWRFIAAAVLVVLLAGCSGAGTPTDADLAEVCMDLAEPGPHSPDETRALADRAAGTKLEPLIDQVADAARTLTEVAARCNKLTNGRAFPTYRFGELTFDRQRHPDNISRTPPPRSAVPPVWRRPHAPRCSTALCES